MAAERARVEGVTICANCHSPVAFLDTRLAAMEAVCEVCARRGSAYDAVRVRGAATMIAAAATIGWHAGLSLQEIRAIVERALEEPSHDVYDLCEPPNVPSWADGVFEHDTRFVPLDAGKSRADG